MSHRSVLRRGFSVTRLGGRIVRSAGQVGLGDMIDTELADGRIASKVHHADRTAPADDAPRQRAKAPPDRKARPDEKTLFD